MDKRKEILAFIKWRLAWGPKNDYTLEEDLADYLFGRRGWPELKEVLQLDDIKKYLLLI